MKNILLILTVLITAIIIIGCKSAPPAKKSDNLVKLQKDPNNLEQIVTDNKIIIYQVMTRLFGNTNTTNKYYGSKEENGIGKFNDFTTTALNSLKDFGFTHIWYTGVIEHATASDNTQYGIPLDDVDVIKGKAGSPYAIKDYYDVNPDLATDVPNRMKEFEALVQRTHDAGLKVVIDFVPNHVARKYSSDAKPESVKDFGENDDTSKAFSPNNNFYYLPGKDFIVPKEYEPLGKDTKHSTKDQKFLESPAKVTGNDQFTNAPSINDWFETVKLNYGVDIKNGRTKNFSPTPDTWKKMKDILTYWTNKGVDGFRCDMAEMVPVEFWAWVIPQIKKVNPEIKFIAEIYNKGAYKEYIRTGKFDYLYDKVGLYDALKPLMQGKKGSADQIYYSWRNLKDNIHSNMLYFLENHDEQRIAYFAKDPWTAVPAMTLSATFSSGPVMMYFGQEVGEPGDGVEGFQKQDGRTTIFDFWGVPNHQKWVNDGKFDGGQLNDAQKKLRNFYSKLLKLVQSKDAFRKGKFYETHFANKRGQSEGYDDKKMYSFIRYTNKEAYLMVFNFNKEKTAPIKLKIPQTAWDEMGLDSKSDYELKDVFLTDTIVPFNASNVTDRANLKAGIKLQLDPVSAYIFKIEKK